MDHDNTWEQYGDDEELGDTWMLVCVMGKSTGWSITIRQVNAPGFHANVWNEHGSDEKQEWEKVIEIEECE